MNYIISSEGYTSALLRSMHKLSNCLLLKNTEQLNDLTANDKVYLADENLFIEVVNRFTDTQRQIILKQLKDKFFCRRILQNIFPDFYYQSVSLKDLPALKLDNNKRYIIKPRSGFFGIGVREITANTDLQEITTSIKHELADKTVYYSKSVFNREDMLVEEYIAGEEYAVDMFYDKNGKPIITSICHHPAPLHAEYGHLLYYTYADLYDKYHATFINFFTTLNSSLNISSLPLHVEFRHAGEQFIPIEFNINRFGGYGLSDLPYHAFGYNPVEYYFADKAPDWQKIWSTKYNKYYGWVLAYNGSGIDINTHKPDHAKFKSLLPNILHYCELDYRQYPVFAIAYVEGSKAELLALLNINFRELFIPTSA
jgi:hypothetical protein